MSASFAGPIVNRMAKSDHKRTWVIEPRRSSFAESVREVWRYRHLIAYFGSRALEKTYARTVLGWLWVFIRPLFPIAVGTLIFGGLIGVDPGPVPYFLFYMTGMTVWHLFDQALMWSTRSLELNRRIVKKLYVPKLILPLSYVTPALVELLIHIGLIVCACLYFWVSDGRFYLTGASRLLGAFGALFLALMLAVGLGLWICVPAAKARDVRFTLRYVLGFWFYFTPVIYPVATIPAGLRWLAAFNPMAVLVEMFKWGTLGIGHFDEKVLLSTIVMIVCVVVSGLWFFSREEALAVDRL
jgi:lipopolysaccharide transport system permease protein